MIFRFLFSVYLVVLIAACSSESLPELSEEQVILAFGDSLTSGVGVNKEHSYPSQLAKLSGLQVINAGVSGETTEQGVSRFNKLLDQLQPDLIILMEGGNDILRNLSMDQTKSNLSKMIERANSDGVPVILMGIPKKSLFSSSAPLYAELAEKYQLVFDGETVAEIIKSPSMKSDSVHFNQKGYYRLAEIIHQRLKATGALQ